MAYLTSSLKLDVMKHFKGIFSILAVVMKSALTDQCTNLIQSFQNTQLCLMRCLRKENVTHKWQNGEWVIKINLEREINTTFHCSRLNIQLLQCCFCIIDQWNWDVELIMVITKYKITKNISKTFEILCSVKFNVQFMPLWLIWLAFAWESRGYNTYLKSRVQAK